MSLDQVLAVLGTFIITYVFYQSLGPRNTSLFLSREQKALWDTNVKEGLGRWLVVTSIFATLTGFATYLFLLGSSKLFGLFALSTGITIALSAPVTRWLTRPFLADARISQLFKANDQVSSVIATLFWSDTPSGRACSTVVKWISLLVIAAIIWVECTAFVDLTFWVAGYTVASDPSVLLWRFVAMALVVLLIVYFVLRYGIRGFVFADLLHTPLIAIAAISLLVGALWLATQSLPDLALSEIIAPVLSAPDPVIGVHPGWIFAAHVLVLNLFQVTCTEHHWFRMWLFGETELSRQFRGTALTGLVWLAMLPVGFLAFFVSNAPGEAAIGSLVPALSDLFSWFGVLFWIGATAALFSTADMQIYSGLLVSRFNASRGCLEDISLNPLKSLLWAACVALAFAAAYTGARAAALPLEKIIFVMVPMCTVLLPAFLHFRWKRVVMPWVLVLSLFGYGTMAALGFRVEEHNFFFTLSAVFVPLLVSVLTLPFVPRRA